MTQLNIKQLMSGGIITNYFCTSSCGHCLYNCSPKWEKRYIDADTAAKSLKTIRALGCRSVHIDLFGNYIPGLCSGLAIAIEDLGTPLSDETYPVLTTLCSNGIRGLVKMAAEACGYSPQKDLYINKCDLCTEVRSCMVQAKYNGSDELSPEAFYIRR